MKIIDIEVIPISLPLSSRYDNAAGRRRMYDIDQQVAVKIHTDAGITGHGSYEDRPDIAPSEMEPLIDTNPSTICTTTITSPSAECEKQVLTEMADSLPNLAMDDTVWAAAFDLARQARIQGYTVPATDLAIIACAHRHGVSLEHVDSHLQVLQTL
ncbi:MAG TPA: hypothetical protein EYQ31_10010 [Candidatus Handelsmanbacteria bacterium]|nr:hypothetical protein [Candidatus Handelsmanbacteria bacterium]